LENGRSGIKDKPSGAFPDFLLFLVFGKSLFAALTWSFFICRDSEQAQVWSAGFTLKVNPRVVETKLQKPVRCAHLVFFHDPDL
jgi:hypothetical protein